jgi:hypothetical protein
MDDESSTDRNGVLQTRDILKFARPFSEGLAAVPSRGEYLNQEGQVVLSGFADCMSFSEARAGAKSAETGKWGFIDRTGAWVIQPTWAKVGGFRLGLAKVWFADSNWGYIDMKGDVIWRMPRRGEEDEPGTPVDAEQ